MVKKTYCDYCNDEILSKEHALELVVNAEDVDICDVCGKKVSETLQGISKKEE